MARAIEPPPKKKLDDNSDALAALFDDGTELPKVISQSESDSQPDSGSQPESAIPARQNDSQPESDSQPDPDWLSARDSQMIDLISALPVTSGFLKLPNTIVDNLLRLLDTDAQAVYLQLYRLSHGNGKPMCWVSLPKLSERTNIKMTSLKAAVKRLEKQGLITKTQITLGYGKAQGVEYRVSNPDRLPESDRLSPPGSLSDSGYIKETHTKEHTQTQDGVRVGSRFSLAECRNYAEHLRATGQGITNPGGYATRIHRTGEADDFVAAFLVPTPAQTGINFSQCPDCRGTGFYEPGGAGKGVARCKHERLSPA